MVHYLETETGFSESDFYLNFDEYIHKAIRLHRVDHLFTQTEPQFSSDNIFLGSEYNHSIWLGREDNHYPPIIIADRDGYVHDGREQYSLKTVTDPGIIERYTKGLPFKQKMKLVDVLNDHGCNLPTKLEDIDLNRELAISRAFAEPIPSLKDPSILDKIGDTWTGFTHELTGWNAPTKDPRLRLVQKPHLLRGLNMRLNPHSMICTNGGTSKTLFYKKVGIVVDRATKSSMTGFAKSPDEVFTSTMHHNELPYCIDQIESNYWNILNQAFNLLEDGKARVDVGSTKVYVEGNFSLSLLANPTESTTDPTQDFSLLLNHLSKNPALGRRFGPIIYDNNYSTLPPGKESDLKDWDKGVTFFRAVEDYTRPKLKETISNPQVWEWVGTSIDTYKNTIESLTQEISDDYVRNFLREHGKAGQHRVRSAALYSSLVDNMNKIALDAITVDELIEDAQHRLGDFFAINIESIQNIASGYNQIKENMVKVWFSALAEYQKIIVSACELFRRQQPVIPNIALTDIGKAWKHSDEYHSKPEYLSKHIDTLKRHPQTQKKLNEKCQEYLQFSIYPRNDLFYVHYSNLAPHPEIEPIGILDFSTISTFLQPTDSDTEQKDGENKTENEIENCRKIENVEKTGTVEKSVEKRRLSEEIKELVEYLSTQTDSLNINALADGLGWTLDHTKRIISVTDKDGTTFQPKPGVWRLI